MARFHHEQDPIELPGSESYTKATFKLFAEGQRTDHEKLVYGIAAVTTTCGVALRGRRHQSHHALRATIEDEKEPRDMEMKILRRERALLQARQIAKDRHQHRVRMDDLGDIRIADSPNPTQGAKSRIDS